MCTDNVNDINLVCTDVEEYSWTLTMQYHVLDFSFPNRRIADIHSFIVFKKIFPI